MNETWVLRRPEYAARFRCVGPDCEDTCCAGWTVPLDEATCRKYDAVSPGALRELLDANVERLERGADGAMPQVYARVRLRADHVCPFLTEGRLCRIQAECGEEYLSTTCATYPRIKHRIDGLEEMALSLSCPEAARLVLGTKDLLGIRGEGEYRLTWEESQGDAKAEQVDVGMDWKRLFWPMREFVLMVLTRTEYALWQRLFLLGVFVRQLEGVNAGARGFLALLGGFRAAIEEGSFQSAMEAIEPDLEMQLDMVLRLAGMKLSRSFVGTRFVETLGWFTRGIGNEPGTEMRDLIRGYRLAHDRYYEPFFQKRGYMLENLLVNAAFKSLFPFGSGIGSASWKPSFEREFALLAAQFALMKGLLIGVAGFHREGFAEEHVIQTVQSASKHFEHHPAFLEETYKLLSASGLDTPRGLTMLMRN